MRNAIPSGGLARLLATAGLVAALTVAGGTGTAAANPPGSGVGAMGVCETAGSGYYCLWQHAYFNPNGGKVWIEDDCFGNRMTPIPSDYRDMASAWMHRQHGGAWVRVFNYLGSGNYQTLWDMRGSDSEDPLVDGSDNDKADTIRNHC